jgi:hypothetical protein
MTEPNSEINLLLRDPNFLLQKQQELTTLLAEIETKLAKFLAEFRGKLNQIREISLAVQQLTQEYLASMQKQ